MNFRFLKVVSASVLLTFIATNVNPAAYANPPVSVTQNFAAPSETFPFFGKILEIPSEFGRVTDRLTGQPGAPALIHIQSAHGSYGAEKNIENLLGHIEKNSSVRLMLLEGAAGKLQPELFRIFPKHPDFNRKVTDKLMQEGVLTGPENFLIESESRKTEGWGIENLEAYKKDRDAFIAVVKKEGTSEKHLSRLRAAVDKRFAAKLGKDLLIFTRQEEALDSGTLTFTGWLKILGEASKRHLKTDLSDAFYQDQYPSLVRYDRLQSIGSKIDSVKAHLEADAFLKELEQRGISKEVIGLFKTELGMSSPNALVGDPKLDSRLRGNDRKIISDYSSLRHAFDLAFEKLPKNFSMNAWPNWALYAQNLILVQEVEGKGLQNEIARLSKKIQVALTKTSAEKEYLTAVRDLRLRRKLFRLELTREEYEELRGRNISENRVGVETAFAKAIEFYETAIVREKAMFANALKRMSDAKQSHAIIVTGGFHADGLKKLARERNASYLQITPRIAEVSRRDHEVYLKSMMGARAVATSQAVPLLGVNPMKQRVFVTGPDQTGAWRSEIRSLIAGEINSEPVSVRSSLQLSFANSIFGSPLSALTPDMSRAEARQVPRTFAVTKASVFARSEVRVRIKIGQTNVREDDGAMSAYFDLADHQDALVLALKQAGIEAAIVDETLPGDLRPEDSGPTYEHDIFLEVPEDSAAKVQNFVNALMPHVETTRSHGPNVFQSIPNAEKVIREAVETSLRSELRITPANKEATGNPTEEKQFRRAMTDLKVVSSAVVVFHHSNVARKWMLASILGIATVSSVFAADSSAGQTDAGSIFTGLKDFFIAHPVLTGIGILVGILLLLSRAAKATKRGSFDEIHGFTLAERDKELGKLRGKTLAILFDPSIDGPQTAARLLTETFQKFGVIITKSPGSADAQIYIGQGDGDMRFEFFVGRSSNDPKAVKSECGPMELTASIMRATCIYFKKVAGVSPKQMTSVSKLVSRIQRGSASEDEGREIIALGESAMDDLLEAITETNRAITTAVIAEDFKKASQGMEALSRMIYLLGKIKSSRGVKAALDALADSSGVPLPAAIKLLGISADALVAIGKPAIPQLKANLNDSRPPVREAIAFALSRIEDASDKSTGHRSELREDSPLGDRLFKGFAFVVIPTMIGLAALLLTRPYFKKQQATVPPQTNSVLAGHDKMFETLMADISRSITFAPPPVLEKPTPTPEEIEKNKRVWREILDLDYEFEDVTPTLAQKVRIDELIKIVNTGDSRNRTQAALDLAQIGPVAMEAVPALLLQASKNPDLLVRYYSAIALVALGPATEEVVPFFSQLLEQQDPILKMTAQLALCEFGTYSRPAVPMLIKLLHDPNPTTRAITAKTLGHIGSLGGADIKKALPQLVALLDDENPNVRGQAVYALGKMERFADPVVPRLRKMLADKDPLVQQSVQSALMKIEVLSRENPQPSSNVGLILQTSPFLRMNLNYGNEEQRYRSAQSLADSGFIFSDALPHLIRALDDPSLRVRLEIYRAFDYLGGLAAEAIPNLIEKLRDENAEIRRKSAAVLGKMGPNAREALDGLEQVLVRDPDAPVRSEAATAIGKINAGVDPIRKTDQEKQPEQKSLYEQVKFFTANRQWDQLVKIGGPALPSLTERLHHGMESDYANTHERQEAARALGRIEDERAIPDLVQALGAFEHGVRKAAAEALAVFQKEEVIQALTENSLDPNPAVRKAIKKSLIQLNAKSTEWEERRVAAKVKSAYESLSNPTRKEEGIRNLVAVGKPAVPKLTEWLDGAESNVAVAIIQALEQIGDRRAFPVLAYEARGWLNQKQKDPQVRLAAHQAIFKFQDVGKMMPVFAGAGLNDPDSNVQKAVANWIIEIGKPAIPYLMNQSQETEFVPMRGQVPTRWAIEARKVLIRLEEKGVKAVPPIRSEIRMLGKTRFGRLIPSLFFFGVVAFFALARDIYAASFGVPNGPSVVMTQPGDSRIFVRDRKQDSTLSSQNYALTIKGVNWSPASVNSNPQGDPSAFRQEFFKGATNDIPLMAKMGVNVARLYYDMGTNAQARAVLDLFYQHGIKVIMPVTSPYYGDTVNSNNIAPLVRSLKDHPTILGWGIGNEWDINYYYDSFSTLRQAAQFTEQSAQRVKSLDTNHAVFSFYGDPHITMSDYYRYHYLDPDIAPWQDTNAVNFTSIVINHWVPSVDVWGLQLYRNASFTDALDQWRRVSRKPMFVSEYGADSFDHRIMAENQAMQRDFNLGLWDEIYFNLAPQRTNGIVSGALSFEWQDEWYKGGNPGVHNYSSEANYGQPDGNPGVNDEEWFGLLDIARTPKLAYYGMQSRFSLDGAKTIPLVTNPVVRVTSGNPAIFELNGKTVYARGGGDKGGRGLNIAILDEKTGIRIKEFRHFDTWYKSGNNAYMQSVADYLNSIPAGSIVMISVADNSGLSNGYSGHESTFQAIEALGSTQVRSAPVGTWALIAKKGTGKLAETSSATPITVTIPITTDPDAGRRQALVPVTTPKLITAVKNAAGNFQFTFRSQDAMVYQIEYTDDLRTGNWKLAQRGIVADGASTTWTDDGSFTGTLPQTTSKRFYRITAIDRVNRSEARQVPRTIAVTKASAFVRSELRGNYEMRRTVLDQMADLKAFVPVIGYGALPIVRMQKGWKDFSVEEVAKDSLKQATFMTEVIDGYNVDAVLNPMDLSKEEEALFLANGVTPAMDFTGILPDMKMTLAEAGLDIANLVPVDQIDFNEVGRLHHMAAYFRAMRAKYGDAKPQIATVIAPFTLAAKLLDETETAMMIGGNDVETLDKVMAYTESFINAYVDYLIKEGGVDGIMFLDPSTGIAFPRGRFEAAFEKYSVGVMNRLSVRIRAQGRLIGYHPCKPMADKPEILRRLASIYATADIDIMSVDAAFNLLDVDRVLEAETPVYRKPAIVMGNIKTNGDYVLGDGTPEAVALEVARGFGLMGARRRLVCTSCDLQPKRIPDADDPLGTKNYFEGFHHRIMTFSKTAHDLAKPFRSELRGTADLKAYKGRLLGAVVRRIEKEMESLEAFLKSPKNIPLTSDSAESLRNQIGQLKLLKAKFGEAARDVSVPRGLVFSNPTTTHSFALVREATRNEKIWEQFLLRFGISSEESLEQFSPAFDEDSSLRRHAAQMVFGLETILSNKKTPRKISDEARRLLPEARTAQKFLVDADHQLVNVARLLDNYWWWGVGKDDTQERFVRIPLQQLVRQAKGAEVIATIGMGALDDHFTRIHANGWVSYSSDFEKWQVFKDPMGVDRKALERLGGSVVLKLLKELKAKYGEVMIVETDGSGRGDYNFSGSVMIFPDGDAYWFVPALGSKMDGIQLAPNGSHLYSNGVEFSDFKESLKAFIQSHRSESRQDSRRLPGLTASAVNRSESRQDYGHSEVRETERLVVPQVSWTDTSFTAKIDTAVRVAANTVSPLLYDLPAYAAEMKPVLFAGTTHYQTASVVPATFVKNWPTFSAILSPTSSASANRMVIDVRDARNKVPNAKSVLPLATFAFYNPKATVVLALIADARAVRLFRNQLAALSPKGKLPTNLKIDVFPSEAEFVAEFHEYYNSAVPFGGSVALVTDREDSLITEKIGSRRNLLSVVGGLNPLKQTASTLLAADKLLDESIWSMGYRFVAAEKLGGLDILMAELTNYLAGQARTSASA